MAKYIEIATKLEKRIRHGDYRLRSFPSHAALVTELEANPRTVTKALDMLIDRGFLIRQRTGRVILPDQNDKAVMHLGLVAPAYPTSLTFLWHRGIHGMVQERGWELKFVPYTHWEDTGITDALQGLDGVFFIGIGDNIPPEVLDRMRQSDTPVVALEVDTSAKGLPCIRLSNPADIHKLLNHLRDRGHQRVDCLNTQPMNPIIRDRIQSWQLWSAAHEASGTLINEPVHVFGPPVEQAYRVAIEAIRANRLQSSALFCVTSAAAFGVMRALQDTGRRVGKDIDICAGDDSGHMAEYSNPSLTCLKDPNIKPYIHACLNWFARGGRDWVGSLLIQPFDSPLFIGESTGGASPMP